MKYIFQIVFMTCNAAFLVLVFKIIIQRVKQDLGYIEPESKDIFSKQKFDTEFRKYDSIIAIFTAFALFGIIHQLILDDFYEWLMLLKDAHNYSTVGLLIVVFVLGNSSAFIIMREALFTERTNIRANPIVTWYLAFIFFSLLYTFWYKFDLKYNLVKAVVLAFLFGNGFYYIFRQNIKIRKWIKRGILKK